MSLFERNYSRLFRVWTNNTNQRVKRRLPKYGYIYIYTYIFSFRHNSESWLNNFWRMKENFAKSFETCFNDKLVSRLWNLRFAQVPFNLSRANRFRFYPFLFHLPHEPFPRQGFSFGNVLQIRVYLWSKQRLWISQPRHNTVFNYPPRNWAEFTSFCDVSIKFATYMPMHRGHACATILFSYEYIPKPVLFYFLKTIFAFSRVRAVFIQIVSHNIHFGPLLLGVIGEGEREREGG